MSEEDPEDHTEQGHHSQNLGENCVDWVEFPTVLFRYGRSSEI